MPLKKREKNISVFPDCQRKTHFIPYYCYNCWYLSTSATLHSLCKNLIWCFWTSYLPFNHLSIEINDKVRALRIWLITFNATISGLRHKELKKHTQKQQWDTLIYSLCRLLRYWAIFSWLGAELISVDGGVFWKVGVIVKMTARTIWSKTMLNYIVILPNLFFILPVKTGEIWRWGFSSELYLI